MARKYDGYCECCGKFVGDGIRVHDGDHFINEWECRQCDSRLLLPRKVSMDTVVANFSNERAQVVFSESMQDLDAGVRAGGYDKGSPLDIDRDVLLYVNNARILENQLNEIRSAREEYFGSARDPNIKASKRQNRFRKGDRVIVKLAHGASENAEVVSDPQEKCDVSGIWYRVRVPGCWQGDVHESTLVYDD